MKWAQVQKCRPQNGTSTCKHCKCSVHRDGNACCNILKAFLFQVFVGKRPFHLMCREEQKKITEPANHDAAKGNVAQKRKRAPRRK